MSESKHIYIVYEITCLVNNKIYIGYHKQNPGFGPFEFDGYLGSSEYLDNAIKKYGKKNFSRITLFVYDNKDEACAKEKEIVNAEFIKRKDTYNVMEGGYGGAQSEETRKKISESLSQFYKTEKGKEALKKLTDYSRGISYTPERKIKHQEAMVAFWNSSASLEARKKYQS